MEIPQASDTYDACLELRKVSRTKIEILTIISSPFGHVITAEVHFHRVQTFNLKEKGGGFDVVPRDLPIFSITSLGT